MNMVFRTAAGLGLLALAVSPASAELDAAAKAEIGQVIRDYLIANPEVLEEAIEVLQARRATEAATEMQEKIADNSARIFDSEHQIVLGNPEGAVTIVEFFDYNCGYCKRAVTDMTALIASNPDLRVVLKEFPILSQGSADAASVSIAVNAVAPERYLDFHQELFARPGPADSAKALEVVRDLGIDAAAVTAASKMDSVKANLQEVQDLAGLLGISGTPSYVIGTELVPGAIGYDTLQAMVASARQADGAPPEAVQ